MIIHAAQNSSIMMTGATGFIGHYVLADLLQRGYQCIVILRGHKFSSLSRLHRLVSPLGVDIHQAVISNQLVVVPGDITEPLKISSHYSIQAIVHAAGSTRFERNTLTQDPWKTNVTGFEHVLNLAKEHGVNEIHLVSSAYQCGRPVGDILENHSTQAPDFHNDYEHTKWYSEKMGLDWCREDTDMSLTIYRPSIVVGDRESGRCTHYSGWYLAARGMEMLDRAYEDKDEAFRRSVSLRIPGEGEQCQNIVPVDYVSKMIAGIVGAPQLHGRIYHLVHPEPPSNQLIKASLEDHFGVAGGRFVPERSLKRENMNFHERLFYDMADPVRPYVGSSPAFSRVNTQLAEKYLGLSCRPYDIETLKQLITYGQAHQWGTKKRAKTKVTDHLVRHYFQQYLPRYIPKSEVAQSVRMTVNVGFRITDVEEGNWYCEFKEGDLIAVKPLTEEMNPAFAYSTTVDVFKRSITGKMPPEQAFLSGKANISGDYELAMKMVMILYQFTLEYPYSDAHQQEIENNIVMGHAS